MEYRIEVLRGRILDQGSPIEIQHRPLELALALATHGRVLGSATLCSLMYPELDHEAASHRLRVNASRLRDAAPGLIARARGGVYALGACSIDIDEIASAMLRREAADRYARLLSQLPPLIDADCDRVTPYWGWFNAVSARVHAMRGDACAALIAMDVPHAHAEETLLVARRIVATDPADESAYVLAMRSLLVLQRRIDALRLYKEYERAMRSEYNAEPSYSFEHLTAAAG